MSTNPSHLLFCVNHPSPHMAELFRALEAREDVELDVLFLAAEDPDRDWGADAVGFRHQFLPTGASVKANPAITSTLGRLHRPETTVVLTLYTWPTTWLAARWLHRNRVHWFLMAEPPDCQASPIRTSLRGSLFRLVTRHANGVLAIGRRAMTELEDLGVPRERLHHVQYVIDLSHFLDLPRHQITGPVRFLSVGQLIERKGHDLLLRAFAELDAPASLRIVGEGELRGGLEWLARELGIDDRVCIESPVAYSRRHEAFADADVFVLASRNDGWGMVVPEAMGAGLPVITSPECGAGVDLIAPGTGLIVKQSNLADAMRNFARNPLLVFEEGQRAREHVRHVWTPELVAEKLAGAVSGQPL